MLKVGLSSFDKYDPKAMKLNSDCPEMVYSMNLCYANKNMFPVSFILYLQNKTLPNTGILLKSACWFSIILDFLL